MKKTSVVEKLENLIVKELTKSGDPFRSVGQQNYMKNKVLCRGNTNPAIKQFFKDFKKNDKNYSQLGFNDKIDLATSLLKSKYIDEKLISFSILSDNYKLLTDEHIDSLKELIKEGHVNEWASCDGLAGSVFRPYSMLNKENTIKIANWKD